MEKRLCAGQHWALEQTPPATGRLSWGSVAVRGLSLFNGSAVSIIIFSPETVLEKNLTNTNKMKLLWLRWWGRKEGRQAFQSPTDTQTHTKRHTHKDTCTQTHTDTQRHTHTKIHTHRHIHTHTHTCTHRKTDTQTHIHTHTQTRTQDQHTHRDIPSTLRQYKSLGLHGRPSENLYSGSWIQFLPRALDCLPRLKCLTLNLPSKVHWHLKIMELGVSTLPTQFKVQAWSVNNQPSLCTQFINPQSAISMYPVQQSSQLSV